MKTFGRLHAVNVWVTVVLASTMTVAVLVTVVAAVLVAMAGGDGGSDGVLRALG